ncbi:hypothetical protein [Pandoraea pulmonicola]|uniref:hypothetical protein n=1 Tax=Pandoraea pulmonicola TaxID=93221 RepID=UPI000B1AD048|nr:hypothetical protein [Pandoraea pulmonicola]
MIEFEVRCGRKDEKRKKRGQRAKNDGSGGGGDSNQTGNPHFATALTASGMGGEYK